MWYCNILLHTHLNQTVNIYLISKLEVYSAREIITIQCLYNLQPFDYLFLQKGLAMTKLMALLLVGCLHVGRIFCAKRSSVHLQGTTQGLTWTRQTGKRKHSFLVLGGSMPT
jgi:hypothetical protein